MISDDELSRRLGKARTERRDGPVPDGIAARLVSDARRGAESRSVHRRIVAGAAGLAVVGGGIVVAPAATAAVQRFLAQTDIVFGGSEVIEESEFVDTSAADLGAYIDSIYPEWLPLAPSQTRAGVIGDVRAAYATEASIVQEVGIRRSLERAVYVGWIDEWIAAEESADAERMAAAADVLGQAATWPAMTATDGGGVTHIFASYVERIASGDVDAAQELAQVEDAPSWDGVDRANQPGSYYERFFEDYEATQ